MNRIARLFTLAAVAAGFVAPAAAQAQKEGKPTVAILWFNNGSFGKDAKDFDGLNKGIPDFLITEMSANQNIRVIERDQVVKLLDEQKLVATGAVDRATAVQVGKLLGVHHMIFGGFMGDPKGNFRIDARAVNVESGEIEYVERVDDKSDNIMSLISRLAAKLNTGLKLPAMTRRTGSAGSAPETGAQQAGAPAALASTTKLPMRYAVMYGKALDLKDSKQNARAVELFNAVLKDFPAFGPAKAELAKIGS